MNQSALEHKEDVVGGENETTQNEKIIESDNIEKSNYIYEGWQYDWYGKRYQKSDGSYFYDCWQKIGDYWYCFDEKDM